MASCDVSQDRSRVQHAAAQSPVAEVRQENAYFGDMAAGTLPEVWSHRPRSVSNDCDERQDFS
jgi:hypothetical protein